MLCVKSNIPTTWIVKHHLLLHPRCGSLCGQGVEGGEKVGLARLSTLPIQQLHKGKRSVKLKLWTRLGPQPLLLSQRGIRAGDYSVGNVTTDNPSSHDLPAARLAVRIGE